jgi:hypothetical protein
VPARKTAVLNIDMLQASPGCRFRGEGPTVEEQFLLAKGTYTYSYKIVPVAGATTATMTVDSKK